MTLDDEISALLARAEPLRCLPDLEAERMGLGKLVEQINALRAKQAASKHAEFLSSVARSVEPGSSGLVAADLPTEAEAPAKRKPGRPPSKATQEGADA